MRVEVIGPESSQSAVVCGVLGHFFPTVRNFEVMQLAGHPNEIIKFRLSRWKKREHNKNKKFTSGARRPASRVRKDIYMYIYINVHKANGMKWTVGELAGTRVHAESAARWAWWKIFIHVCRYIFFLRRTKENAEEMAMSNDCGHSTVNEVSRRSRRNEGRLTTTVTYHEPLWRFVEFEELQAKTKMRNRLVRTYNLWFGASSYAMQIYRYTYIYKIYIHVITDTTLVRCNIWKKIWQVKIKNKTMPGIVVFRRRWSVGSDDLVVPGAFLFSLHLIWWVCSYL